MDFAVTNKLPDQVPLNHTDGGRVSGRRIQKAGHPQMPG